MMNLSIPSETESQVRPLVMDNNSFETSSDPPFEETYKELFKQQSSPIPIPPNSTRSDVLIKEYNLPVVNLQKLIGTTTTEKEKDECKSEIAKYSKEWGFFQVVNHGISKDVLEEMRKTQVKVFGEPFNKKKSNKCMNMNLSKGSYRWGTPSANCITQFSWSEAFHIPLLDLSLHAHNHVNTLSSTVKEFATSVSGLAIKLAKILEEKLGHDDEEESTTFIEENCMPNTCYLRMNRYPPCPNYSHHVLGLMPHTDSDFLTILYQDQVGGLQLLKDAHWISVHPLPHALIVNIGDLFQAWSNGVYKSVEHRVVASPNIERFSTAYFLCPSYDVVVKSCKEPSIYKTFSFGEYRQQVQDDVTQLGHKIGLSRFLLCN